MNNWEEEITDKNVHSVYTKCLDCLTVGVNLPYNNTCGNCGSENTIRYYDSETINNLLDSLLLKKFEELVLKWKKK